VINAPDELDGLDRLLQSLSDYNFKVTFFLGGDFIRRHPGALKEILAGGHEVGSHFYLNFDFGDPDMRLM
jgi:peptidoglycan/xylan/chitin deacetylase (PgdA/CDA1 family)